MSTQNNQSPATISSNELVEKYLPCVVAAVRSRLGREHYHIAEDVAHDVMVVVIEKWQQYAEKSEDEARKILFGIARNMASKFWLRERRRRNQVPIEFNDPECPPDNSFENEEVFKQAFLRLKSQVGTRDYRIYQLALDGVSTAELAEQFGMKPNAILQVSSRIRVQMREIVAELDGSAPCHVVKAN